MSKLTHLDEKGEARMVDVTDKTVTEREARAEARIHMNGETLRMITEGSTQRVMCWLLLVLLALWRLKEPTT